MRACLGISVQSRTIVTEVAVPGDKRIGLGRWVVDVGRRAVAGLWRWRNIGFAARPGLAAGDAPGDARPGGVGFVERMNVTCYSFRWHESFNSSDFDGRSACGAGPGMVDPQTTRFWQATLQSGLVDAQGLAACWEGIPEEKRDAREHADRRLAREAVNQERLTLWQAQQLLAGRTSGFRVDRYLMLELIGHGGMGRVYLAQDTRLNRQVALKILSPERMNNPRAIARFQREARVGRSSSTRTWCGSTTSASRNGRYFLVMEYIEGKTIGTLIAERGKAAAGRRRFG